MRTCDFLLAIMKGPLESGQRKLRDDVSECLKRSDYQRRDSCVWVRANDEDHAHRHD